MSRWLSSREMRPWNHGWVRWMARVRETDGESLRGGDPHTNHPHQKCSEKPRSPTPGDAGPRPPALRLVPEHGVGRLRRWFVFFCRAEGDTVGVGVSERSWDITLSPQECRVPFCSWGLPLTPLFLPLHGNPYGETVPSPNMQGAGPLPSRHGPPPGLHSEPPGGFQ